MDNEAPLTAVIIHLTSQYGWYSYRQVAALLWVRWRIIHKGVA
jgi:hypothetical protein